MAPPRVRTQTSLNRESTGGDFIAVPVEGVVVGIHYRDDKTNRSKKEIEYDVDVTSMFNLGRLFNVPRTDVMAGIDDGDDNVLRRANTTVGNDQWVADGGRGQRTKPTPRYASDGDRVIVQFINGNPHRPVITGVLTHFSSRRKFEKLDGTALPKDGSLIRRKRHRGTEMVMDEKGNVEVVFGKTPDEKGKDTDDKKKLTIIIGDFTVEIDNSVSPTVMHIKGPDGDVFKLTKDGLELGVSPSDHMALADKCKTEFDKVYTALSGVISKHNSHVHKVTGIKTSGSAVAQTQNAPVDTAATTSSAADAESVESVASEFVKSK